MKLIMIITVAAMPMLATSGPYTAKMQSACPQAWEDTTKSIEVIYPSNDPWRLSDNKLADQASVKSTLAPSDVLATIDPATQNDLVNDPLTIASNCLMYRNFEVDTVNEKEPPAVPVNLQTGWIPAAIL